MRLPSIVIVFGLVVILYTETMSQSTFNRRYDTGGVGFFQNCLSVEEADSSRYMIFGATEWVYDLDTITLYAYSVIVTYLLDSTGNVLNEFLQTDTTQVEYVGWTNSASRLNNGNYMLGGSSAFDSTQAPVLFFYDANGVLIDEFDYVILGEEWIGRQARECSNGDLVICGDHGVGVNSNGFIMRTDNTGVQQWVQSYPGGGLDGLITIDTCSNGFFSGGQHRFFGQDINFWLMRTDDFGSVIWDTIWGSGFDEPNAHVTTLANGNALVASSWAYAPNYGQMRPYLAEVSYADGSFIWEQQYDEPSFNTTLYSAKEIEPGGDLIAVGQSYVDVSARGILLRTTNGGDSLWMRYYEYSDSLWNAGRGFLFDVIQTYDNGFLAVGTALGLSNDPNDPPLAYSQDIWVVKVDSMGCLLPGCHIVTGIESQVTNYKDALKVWPNPSTSGGQVQLTWELPEAARSKSTELSLVSTTGQLMFSQPIDLAQESIQLDVHDLKPGMYFIHLVQEGTWISGAKLLCLPK